MSSIRFYTLKKIFSKFPFLYINSLYKQININLLSFRGLSDIRVDAHLFLLPRAFCVIKIISRKPNTEYFHLLTGVYWLFWELKLFLLKKHKSTNWNIFWPVFFLGYLKCLLPLVWHAYEHTSLFIFYSMLVLFLR